MSLLSRSHLYFLISLAPAAQYKARTSKAQHLLDVSQELAQLIRARRTASLEEGSTPGETKKKLARMQAVRQTEAMSETAPVTVCLVERFVSFLPFFLLGSEELGNIVDRCFSFMTLYYFRLLMSLESDISLLFLFSTVLAQCPAVSLFSTNWY